MAVCFDTHAPTERHVDFADYKANRQEAPEDIISAIPDIKRIIEGFNIPVVELDGYEADDALGMNQTKDTIICSIDKDLDMIPGNHYNFVKDIHYEVNEDEAIRNFYKQMLTGDRVDNIIGIRGIGPVKASKLLDTCKTELEMYNVCVKAYNDAGEDGVQRVTENGKLLWLLRTKDQVWSPPLA